MKYFLIVGGAFVALGLILVAFLGLGYLSFSNTANGFEVDIKAKYTNNQNVYDNGFKKVVEIAQVPDMQVQGLKTLYDSTMKSRYGADGSKAMLQAIKEQNPTLDQKTYIKIQQTIEEFRNEFQSNQTGLISVKQEYERFLSATTSGRIYNFIGHYPHIDLSVYDIVTSDQTAKAFSTKRDAPLKLSATPAPATK